MDFYRYTRNNKWRTKIGYKFIRDMKFVKMRVDRRVSTREKFSGFVKLRYNVRMYVCVNAIPSPAS